MLSSTCCTTGALVDEGQEGTGTPWRGQPGHGKVNILHTSVVFTIFTKKHCAPGGIATWGVSAVPPEDLHGSPSSGGEPPTCDA